MSNRYHFLDAARGALMILGIAYHGALVYGVTDWVINDHDVSRPLDELARLLTSFRMPAFFLIAGFFAALTLSKYGAATFVRKRVPRIVLPLVVTLFTLNIVQMYVVYRHDGGGLGPLDYVVSRDLWSDFLSERWISHLWFLVCLGWYFAILSVCAAVAGLTRAATTGLAWAKTRRFSRPMAVLPLLPLLNVGILMVLSAFPALYLVRPLDGLDEILTYAPFFVTGLVVYANPTLYESMTRFSGAVLLLTLGVSVFNLTAPVDHGMAMRIIRAYSGYLWSWLAVYWVLVIFRRMLSRPNPVAKTLSESSYTIYLFHHLTVILFGWWMTAWSASSFLKYPLLVTATFLVTFAIHQLAIKRIAVLSSLFNGKMAPAIDTDNYSIDVASLPRSSKKASAR